MIAQAHKMGLLTTPYAFDEEQAKAMAEAGADIGEGRLPLVSTSVSLSCKPAFTHCRGFHTLVDQPRSLRIEQVHSRQRQDFLHFVGLLSIESPLFTATGNRHHFRILYCDASFFEHERGLISCHQSPLCPVFPSCSFCIIYKRPASCICSGRSHGPDDCGFHWRQDRPDFGPECQAGSGY